MTNVDKWLRMKGLIHFQRKKDLDFEPINSKTKEKDQNQT